MEHSFQSVLRDVLDRLLRNRDAFADRFPTVGAGTQYVTTPNDNWLAAFWPGLLWLAYSATGDPAFRDRAEALLPTFVQRLDARVHITHDLGFLYALSARAQWQLTGSQDAHRLALRAAADLARRYRPTGRYIQAWGPVGDPEDGGRIIIDTMMNVPLLFWSGEQTGDPHLQQIARDHVDIAAKHLVRADYSTAHTFFFDQETGAPLGAKTHQGYADDSLWSRGQGWAIHGFATAAQWTGSSDYRDIALNAAERFMAELPADHVATWDLRLPDDAPHYLDTSASAIAAAGMLRLARLLDPATSAQLHEHASTLLRALIDQHLETHPDAQGLLRNGTYHAHKGYGVNEYFICGDYFFLEALLMHDDRCPDLWGPAVSTSEH